MLVLVLVLGLERLPGPVDRGSEGQRLGHPAHGVRAVPA